MGKRERFGQIFIYFVLTLWFASEVILGSNLDKIIIWKREDINVSLDFIILALLLAQIILFQKYSFKELVLIMVISIPIILATIYSDHYKMMSTWIFIISAKYIDFEKVARLSYYVELLMTILVIYLFLRGFITEYTVYRGAILRHSLGFSHPNQLGIRVFLLVVCRCYIRREKFNIFDWTLIILAAVFIKRVADSRTACYTLILLSMVMLLNYILKVFNANYDLIMSIMIFGAALSNGVSIFLSVIQVKENPILSRVDVFMSRRFSECHRTLSYYGISILGQNIKLIVKRPIVGKFYHFWLDNSYMSILLRYGPIVLAIFSWLYLYTMIMLKRKGQLVLVEILCLYSIYGIMENNYFLMSQNLFLLLLSYPVYKMIREQGEKQGMLSRIRISW